MVRPLIGRDAQLDSLVELVHGVRLVSLIGADGAGKTSLALREDLEHRGAERHQEKTAQPHEQRRSRGPGPWLTGKPYCEHSHHRPARREFAQESAGDPGLRWRDEWRSDEEHSSDESRGQRGSHDPTDVSAQGPAQNATW